MRERSGSPSGLSREYEREKEKDGTGNAGGVSFPGTGHAGGTGPAGTSGYSTGGGAGSRERAESYSFVWTSNRDVGPLRRAP